MDQHHLQRCVLQLLGNPRREFGAYLRGDDLAQQLVDARLVQHEPRRHEVQEALWALIGQGLLYIDSTQPAASNWVAVLSANGRAVLSDRAFNPNDPTGFLERLRESIPTVSAVVHQYMEEALLAYNGQLYLASTVMLGAASEAAFIEMATAFASTLTGLEGQKFKAILSGKSNFVQRFAEFRKRIEPRKSLLPDDYSDGMTLLLDSVLDLLRTNRNEAGHPTGRRFSREDCYTSLEMAARYLKRLYGLKEHFEGELTRTS